MCLKSLCLSINPFLLIGAFLLTACTPSQRQSFMIETQEVVGTVTLVVHPSPTTDDLELTATQELPTLELALPPTATALVIEQETLKDEGEDPKYTVAVNYPEIAGMEGFNQASQAIAERIVDAFLENLATYPPVGELSQMSYSSVSMDYSVLEKTPEVISVYFQISEYYSGAAHPFPFSAVLNYDVRNQQVLDLSDLFQPNAEYLRVISEYVTNELSGEEWFTFTDGVLPEAENYQIWNLTPEGLLITFDPYMVAPYAAGFIKVVVPYDEFIGIVNPEGVLARN